MPSLAKLTALISAIAAIFGGYARADPAPAGADGGAAPSPSEDLNKEADGRAHYDKGRKLVDSGAYGPALAEFLEARRLWPNQWAPATAAAKCLQMLERSDEAFDILATLLRDQGDRLPAKTKTAVQQQIIELSTRVGTVEILNAEPGASLTIDGQSRGEYPPIAPLRVAAGSHWIRVYKEGFVPVETRVDVAGSHSSAVTLSMEKLARAGVLRVEEKRGGGLDVVVDGSVVGKTPWEGSIAVGSHSVALRGPEEVGSLPEVVSIQEKARKAITLSAEPLAASIAIKPSPVEASVAVDGIFVSRGAWEGRMHPGSHSIRVVADGYFTEERKVALQRGQGPALKIELRRDPDAIRWRRPGRFGLEVGLGLATAKTLGGEVAGTCAGECEAGAGIGAQVVVHVGYEIWNGFGFGASVGYLRVQQALEGRVMALQPVGLPEASGAGDDTLKLRGFRASLWASYRVGEGRVRGRLRLGAGALVGTMSDVRTGQFVGSDRQAFQMGPVVEAPTTAWFHVAPEAKVAWLFMDRWELSAGLEGMILIAPEQPAWSAETQVYAASDGNATFPAQTLAGQVIGVFVPGLSVRHDF